MFEFDPLVLARIQFALNISFHILFPVITIDLAWILLYFRVRYTLSKNDAWEYAYYFWVKIFALTFALGVVSGITMSFQFGTNWPGFIEKAGNIAGPLLGYEVLTAFFLEATFLGVMLFGKNRVSNRAHLLSSAVVALGTSLSAFWILSLNSWMQTPQGYEIIDGVFHVLSWTEVIFNPSFPYRLVHMLVACLLTASFLVAGVSAWRMFNNVDGPATLLVMRTGVFLAMILSPLQLFIGDLHGLNTFEHQPSKVAAIEGVWETEKGAPLLLFAIPNDETRSNDFALGIPGLASLILTHEWDGEITGLNEFKDEHPPVAFVFWSFRVMVGTGMLMIAVSWWAGWTLLRRKENSRTLLIALSAMTFSGWLATLAGWYVTEVGRQPWIVYQLLRTSDIVAPHGPSTVLATLVSYFVLYGFLLISYIATLRYLSTKPAASLAMTNSGRED
ncbi:MAG: cytochrome ubiquinol oxidase subunit I [Gammaproteobacteria bacterium]|nr:cytochrome ubiquinol oxidase subunit I [Gammaproteobacteria bacterium]